MSSTTEEAWALLQSLSQDRRETIFQRLRHEFSIHPLEDEWNIPAEVILESIARGGDLTMRMMRGVIAETAFEMEVVAKLDGWQGERIESNLAYDFFLTDGKGPVKVQVKLQRCKDGRPARANTGYRRFSPDMYYIEPQKTRKGEKGGKSTRPYRFGEFDVLAASMWPSTQDWSKFMFTPANWLLPNPKDPACILKFQPIPMQPNDDWTDDFETCVEWFRAEQTKTIRES